MTIKILIVEDGLFRRKRLEETLKFLGVKYISVDTLEEAKSILKSDETVNGIVTDMSFPINTNEDANDRAGDRLLDWLKENKVEIPVLGISTCGFSVDYPQIKGQMPGCVEPFILKKFISSIKEDRN